MRPPSLIAELLADQGNLTAVERFSRTHDEAGLAPGARYRDLLPATAPPPGEQYAFEVELDKCSGCKACVTACHSLNGLDENETWRDVGLLVSPPSKPWAPTPAIQQHITTACHHCVDPGCLNGCPVLAYEKDAVTGIVRHLDDQCIGCQYCVLKCPYDVPKYNARLGIVRKCDMCSNRLSAGEAPACVQACPNEAIRITKVQTSTVTIEFREQGRNFLSGAPAGDYTLPTTLYRSAGSAVHAPQLIAADSAALSPQPAHWPLVIMLVLSQASVGVAVVAALQPSAPRSLLVMSLALAVLGLGASVFHLGRPLGAWRAFLNLKRSWMSREIVVFGLFPPLLAGAVALAFGAPASGPAWLWPLLRTGSEAGAPIVGLLGVFCSVMIYHDTRRPLWHWRRSGLLFFGTACTLGAAGAAVLLPAPALFATVIAATLLKLVVEISVLRHGTDRALTPLKKTALLITNGFQEVTMIRLACAMLGGVCMPLLLLMNLSSKPALFAALGFTLLLAGELMERFLYFTTVAAPKMPGGVPA